MMFRKYYTKLDPSYPLSNEPIKLGILPTSFFHDMFRRERSLVFNEGVDSSVLRSQKASVVLL